MISAVLVISLKAQTPEPKPNQMMDASAVADSIISYAKTFIGTPYKYGAVGPKTFDCSGFTSYVYRHFGYKLSRTSGGQGTDGRAVPANFKHLQKGDIVLFSRGRNATTVGHAGIFIALDDSAGTSFSFIHASNRGVIISHSNEGYYSTRYLFARRILPDFDEVRFLADSAVYAFGEKGYIGADRLTLGENDQRIVLFGNGAWAFVDSAGVVTKPDSTTRKMILNLDGTWGIVEPVKIEVPTEKPAPSSQNTTVSVERAAATSTNQPETAYYKVKQGDTLSKIAREYNTSVKALCRLNGIRENAILKVGQRLRVK